MKRFVLALMVLSCVFLMCSCEQSIGNTVDAKALQGMFEEGNYSDVSEKNFSNILESQTEVTNGRVEL